MYITGFHAIDERLRSLRDVHTARLLVAKSGPRVKQLIETAAALGVAVEKSDAAALDRLAADHRGVVLVEAGAAASSASNRTSVEAFLRALPPDAPALVVLLDGITDPHNLGAILRSCDQFAVDLAVYPNRRSATDESALTARASSGAASWVPTAEVPNLTASIQALQAAGFWVYGADGKGTPACETRFPARCALVMGSEGSGLSRLVAKHCDAVVGIPTKGHVDSLNVSVATGILLYEIRRGTGL
jgi:23S rRNA (guanosine2251-2'-O)-methyltransferase